MAVLAAVFGAVLLNNSSMGSDPMEAHRNGKNVVKGDDRRREEK